MCARPLSFAFTFLAACLLLSGLAFAVLGFVTLNSPLTFEFSLTPRDSELELLSTGFTARQGMITFAHHRTIYSPRFDTSGPLAPHFRFDSDYTMYSVPWIMHPFIHPPDSTLFPEWGTRTFKAPFYTTTYTGIAFPFLWLLPALFAFPALCLPRTLRIL